MPAIGLDQIQNREEPAPAWRWLIELPASNLGSDVLRFYGENADLTHTFIESAPTFVGGTYVNYPKNFSIEPFDVVFYEDKNFLAYNTLVNWRLDTIDRKGNYKLPVHFKKVIRFTLHDLQGNEAMRFTYEGCWPMRFPNYQLVADSSDRIRTNITFCCDKGGRDVEFVASKGITQVTPGDPETVE